MAFVTARAKRRLATERRMKVATLYARYCRAGNPNGVITRIAAELGVVPSTVFQDLKALDIEWRETAADAIATIKAKLIADIERDLSEAREEWLRSREHTPTEDVVEGRPDGKGGIVPERASRRKRSASADTRYLQATTAMRDQLAKLVGAYAPEKVAPTTPDGAHPYDLTIDYRAELERRLAALAARRAAIRSDGDA